MFLILHNIRSAYNVGALLRTADAAGVLRVYFTGYTPAPRDRFGRWNVVIAKTALGAEQSVPWEQVSRLSTLLKRLHREGFFLLALEQALESQDYRTVPLVDQPTALVLGNEVRGLSHRVRILCDAVISIPMHGKKESLNVSVAGGIALFHVRDRLPRALVLQSAA